MPPPQLAAALAGGMLAHGLGDAADLPLPFGIVLWGTGAAVLGLAALTGARRAPAWLTAPPSGRRDLPPPGPLARACRHPAMARVLQAAMLVLLAILVVLGVAGPDRAAVNPVPWLVHGVFWAGLVPLSLLLGGVWRAANPLRLVAAGLARLTGDPDDVTARPVPDGWGVWPAAVLLAVFAWSELALPAQPRLTLLVVLAVVLAVLAGAVRHGQAWLDRGDPFEVYSRTLGTLSPVHAGDGGGLALRSPRARLASVTAPAGLGAVVAVLVGADLFDGLLASLAWQNLKVGTGAGARVLIDTAGLAGCMLAVGLLVRVATNGVRELLPALLPVVAAYAVAHYTPVLLVEPEVALGLLSDPLGRGWDLLGTAGAGGSYDLLPGAALAVGLLVVLLAGHLAAVVVASDRAVAAYGRARAGTLQLPLRALLVVSALASVAVRFSGG